MKSLAALGTLCRAAVFGCSSSGSPCVESLSVEQMITGGNGGLVDAKGFHGDGTGGSLGDGVGDNQIGDELGC